MNLQDGQPIIIGHDTPHGMFTIIGTYKYEPGEDICLKNVCSLQESPDAESEFDICVNAYYPAYVFAKNVLNIPFERIVFYVTEVNDDIRRAYDEFWEKGAE